MRGCSCGTATTAWFADGGVAAAECSLVHCSASRDGDEADDDGCDDGDGDVAVQRRDTSSPLSDLVHLGGGKRSSCRHLVLQRWQLQTFQCHRCFFRKQVGAEEEDSGPEL